MGFFHSWKTKVWTIEVLKIPHRAVASPKVLAHVHDKCQSKIDDDRRPEREEGGVYEEQAYARRGNTQLFTQCRTDAKRVALEKIYNPFHKLPHSQNLD